MTRKKIKSYQEAVMSEVNKVNSDNIGVVKLALVLACGYVDPPSRNMIIPDAWTFPKWDEGEMKFLIKKADEIITKIKNSL